MRLFGLLAFGFWVVMMTLLVKKDVLPVFGHYGDPTYRTLLRNKQNMERTEMGIWRGDKRVGSTSEVIVPDSDGGYRIQDEAELDCANLIPRYLELRGTLTIRSNTVIDPRCELSSFAMTVQIRAEPTDVPRPLGEVHGAVIGNELVMTVEGPLTGMARQEKRIQLDGPMMLNAGLSPFLGMPELREGVEWTIVSVSPIEAVTGRLTPEAYRARVVGKETLDWFGVPTEVFKVEVTTRQALASDCIAWITPDGRILKERMDILEMRREDQTR